MSSNLLNVSGNIIHIPNTSANQPFHYYDTKIFDVNHTFDVSNIAMHINFQYASVTDNNTMIEFELFFDHPVTVRQLWIGETLYDIHVNETNRLPSLSNLSLYSQTFSIVCKSNNFVILSKMFIWES